MNNFSIVYLSPYILKEQELGFFDEDQLVDEFNKIPWYENIMDCFYDGSSAVPPKDYIKTEGKTTIQNVYWHFGIASEYLGKRLVIYIIPNYAIDTNFKKTDIRFSIEYGRPKKEKTSKLARFFGAPPEKTNPQFTTHITDITFNETRKIITEFGHKNLTFLDEKISFLGTIY